MVALMKTILNALSAINYGAIARWLGTCPSSSSMRGFPQSREMFTNEVRRHETTTKKGRDTSPMNISRSEPCNDIPLINGSLQTSPLILMSGDNIRTASTLHRALCEDGFRVQLAASYCDLEPMWRERQPLIVLLEVSGAHSVEAAVKAALNLKRLNPLQFIAYAADPALYTSGLAGDAIFPRTAEHLAEALRHHFDAGL
jgi:hypothetical protein